MTKSETLMNRACKVLPGGVNSPVRSYKSVGMTPRFIASASGAYVIDADGRRYIDYINSYGPIILGHAHPIVLEAIAKAAEKGLSFGAPTEAEVEMAEFLCGALPFVDMVRMVNSGTEAVMSAIRAARAFTGREKIIKFAGCYHGHSDGLLVQAGSGLMTQGTPDSAGVTGGCAKDTLSAVYNDIESVKALFSANPDGIAAVIIEPLAANMGVVLPKKGFLSELKELCRNNGALLIFDEVITGFRLSFGGAAEYYGVHPDLVTYGKIIGGGMPVGAYGGRREIMEQIAPLGNVYQAGTLSGNPLAMAGGLAQLRELHTHPEYYEILRKKGEVLFGGLQNMIQERNLPYCVNYCESLGSLFFAKQAECYADVQQSDTKLFSSYFRAMLENGIHFAPSQFEASFLSLALGDEEINRTLEAAKYFLDTCRLS